MVLLHRLGLRIAGLGLGLVAALFSTAPAQAQSGHSIFSGSTAIQIPGGDERLVVYGGIGAIDPQMRFSKLVDNHGLAAEARELARTASIGNARVLTTRKEVLAALTKRNGKPARTEDIEAAVRGGLLYVLTFVGSFEYYKKLRSGYGAERLIDEHFMVGITPVISRAEDGVVILATPSMQRLQNLRTPDDKPKFTTDEMFARAYGMVLSTSLRSLERVVGQIEEGRGDRYMVTATRVLKPETGKLLGFAPLDLGSLPNYCSIAVPCTGNDKDCRMIASFTAQKMTQTLSERGVAVVPPANWAGWSDNAKVQVDGTVSTYRFAPTGGIGELSKLVSLSIDPAYASKKLVVEIAELLEKDAKIPSIERNAIRFYRTPIQIQWYETPSPYECDRVSDFGVFEQRLEPPFACQRRQLSKFGKAPDEETRRMWGLVALMKAMGNSRYDGGNPCGES